jgi:hypothetical protein
MATTVELEQKTDKRTSEEGRQDALVSEAHQVVHDLRESGKVVWSGGKPRGLRGIAVRGKPVAETIIEDRR